MASGEEAEQTCFSSSGLGLEALLQPEEAERAGGDLNPELMRLRDHLQEWLSQYEPMILWTQRLLVWERPLHSIFVAFLLNTAFWLLSSTFVRPLFLLSVSLLGLVLLERWKHKLPHISVSHPEVTIAERESGSIHPRLLSVPELSHHLAESYHACHLHLQEMIQYKRQNHGKFCGLVCAGSLVLAVVGHYVPGVMISYIILLSVLLWPLVVYNELIQKMYTGLEPILMKLDYSMKGRTQHHKHDKKKVKEAEESDEPRVETESESEEELSCFATTVDVKTTALAMAITDSELSDEEASILESGGFSVSRATTPQLIDISEGTADVDQQSRTSDPEERLSRDSSELLSTKRSPSPCPAQAPGSTDTGEGHPPPSCLHLPSPLHFVSTHFNGSRLVLAGAEPGAAASQGRSLSLEALSQEIVSSAICTVVQNTLSALTRLAESPAPQEAEPEDEDVTPVETDSVDQPACPAPPEEEEAEEEEEEEEFVLLDQSELEQIDEQLGMAFKGQERDEATPTDPPSRTVEES